MGIILSLLVLLSLTVLVITNRIASKSYVGKVLLYLDYFISAVINREPDITISSFCGLALQKEKPALGWRVLGAVLNGLQKDHCAIAIQRDAGRAQRAIMLLIGQNHD